MWLGILPKRDRKDKKETSGLQERLDKTTKMAPGGAGAGTVAGLSPA